EEDRGAHPPRGKVLVGANERRHGGRQAEAVDDVEIEESREQDSELVAGAVRLRGGPAGLPELCVIEQPEDGLRIPYVACEKQKRLAGRTGQAGTASSGRRRQVGALFVVAGGLPRRPL